MILGYNIQQTKKTVVAFLVALLSVAGYFIAFDPGFNAAAVAVVVGLFNVAGVFAAKNHSIDDVQKAVQALAASSLGLIGMFVTVDPSTPETVAGIVLAVVNVYAVYAARNAPAR